MRNDVKPVIPPRDDAGRAGGDYPLAAEPHHPRSDPSGGVGFPPNPPAGEADFDREHGSSVRRERGDRTDPAGPKRSAEYGAMGLGGAVTDPAGTTGPTSRSNDRQSRTTGKLRDRDMERSARMGEAPDVNAYNIPIGTRSLSVPVLMSAMAVMIALVLLVAWWSWPRESVYEKALDENVRAGDHGAALNDE